jgi:hypothetical protein
MFAMQVCVPRRVLLPSAREQRLFNSHLITRAELSPSGIAIYVRGTYGWLTDTGSPPTVACVPANSGGKSHAGAAFTESIEPIVQRHSTACSMNRLTQGLCNHHLRSPGSELPPATCPRAFTPGQDRKGLAQGAGYVLRSRIPPARVQEAGAVRNLLATC